MQSRILAVFFLILYSSLVQADGRLIIHLTNYLATDYAGAISEEHKVLSDFEYSEQKEFAQKVLEEGRRDPNFKIKPELLKSLEDLNRAILSKEVPSRVIPMARKIQKDVLTLSGISLAASAWPDYTKARTLYDNHCLQCHGQNGQGDGPTGAGLDPAPTNFHDKDRVSLITPFAAFNTIRIGVPGTGMGAYTDLTDEEIWSLAFYVSTFRFGEPVKSRKSLSAHATNDEILAQLSAATDEQFKSYALLLGEEPVSFLKKARLYFFQGESADYLARAQSLLNSSMSASQSGDQQLAEQLSLEAYFQGFEPIENKISANDPDAVTRIEEKMSNFRKSIKNKNPSQAELNLKSLTEEISTLQKLLGEDEVTPAFAFLSGFSIILREGFEAVLVILAILGVAKVAASSAVTIAIHSGWIISLILGVVGWYLSGYLIALSGASREVMEATGALFAVLVLVYVGFWMHRQTEISRWKEFIHVKVKNLTLAKNLVGLFMLSFIVTFREVIETVLFLRTVYIDTGDDSKKFIFIGVIVAFAIVLLVSVLITKYRNKIDLKKFFNLSSVLMMVLATILAGKGIHAFQEAGITSMSAFPFKLRIELLGFFPSWETIAAQVVVLMTSLTIWKTAGKKA